MKNEVTKPELGEIRASKLQLQVVRYTPQDALVILENVHPNQRKLNKDRVRKMLASMQNHKWHEPPYTFDSIAFDRHGRLCNGLHRITALSQHTEALTFVVMYGVESPENHPLPVGDNGTKRPDYFVAGIDKDDWAVANFLTMVYTTTSSPSIDQVEKVYQVIYDGIQAISKGEQASVRAGFVFAWCKSADLNYRQQLQDQWQAYCNLSRYENGHVWESLRALRRSIVRAKGLHERENQYCRTLDALNRPDLKNFSRNVRQGLVYTHYWLKGVLG